MGWTKEICSTDWCIIMATYASDGCGGHLLVSQGPAHGGFFNGREVWSIFCESEEEAHDEFDLYKKWVKPIKIPEVGDVTLRGRRRDFHCKMTQKGKVWRGEVCVDPSRAPLVEWGDSREHLAYLLLPLAIERELERMGRTDPVT